MAEVFNPKFLKFIKIGEVSTKLLLILVEDILDLAKFNGNTFKLNINKFKICDIISEIDYIFRFQWIERNIELSIEWSNELSQMEFCSDSKRIKQVLINLISNSFKFTEKGRITIKVKIVYRNGERYVRFWVLDTGIGISTNDMRKLFKMFGMVHKNHRLNKSGSGIGLYISKKIVESLGGEIKVKSEEEKGSWFSFTIKDLEDEYESENLIPQQNEEIKEGIVDLSDELWNFNFSVDDSDKDRNSISCRWDINWYFWKLYL